MPIAGGEHKPQDIVDVANLESSFLIDDVAEPENIPVDYSGVQDSPTVSEVSDLAARNWATTTIANSIEDLITEWPDPNFNQPWATLEPKYLPYKEYFEDAYNPSSWQKAKNSANEDIETDEMFRRMSPADYANYFAVSMTDPIYIVLGLVTGGVATIGKGLSIGQAAARTGLFVGAQATAVEGMLQLADPTRTWDESLFSITAGAATGT